MDTAGYSTPDTHKYGIKRMLEVGVIPITVESLVSEWMLARSNPKSMEIISEMYSHYGYLNGLGMQ